MIRPATPQDAPQIAPLIVLAMGPLAAKFANTTNHDQILALFKKFIAISGNQYSYHNILLDEEDGAVTGMIMAYDGALLHELRRPFLEYTQKELGFKGTPEDETAAGEYYIDCLAVHPQYQGKGIAKALINAMVQKAALGGHATAGLLVSNGNHGAKKLYTGLGFREVGVQALLGGTHYHLQRTI